MATFTSSLLPYGSGKFSTIGKNQNMYSAIRRIRKEKKLSLEKLSEDVGISISQLSRFESGDRQPRVAELERIATRLGVTSTDLIDSAPAKTRLIPLVGYVGAGAETHAFDHGQGPFDMVDAPDGSTDSTVAVEIRGESLGSFFDRWLVFYNDVRDPVTPDLIGKLCVVGLPDGRVLIKKLARGQQTGLYTLQSQFEPPIYDTGVLWAAKVKTMVPR